jgi:CubicO group peptidase (beta-lactamase class C family)
LLAEAGVPGLALAQVRGGEVAQVAACGVRSLRTREPVSERTVFEAASLSKPVFAYAALRLVDAGELSLDEPLSKYDPKLPGDPRAARITARHILCHTTGLPNWRGDEPLRTHFAPGERFSYSGEGFARLQRVVERVTGEPLEALARRLVFAPLGMPDSSYSWQERFGTDHAAPHDAALRPETKSKRTEANAAFSLHTTALDYAQFLRATLSGTGLEDSTAQAWLEPQVNVPRHRCESIALEMPDLDDGVAWALGWGLELETGMFFHWGANPGFQAFAIGSPRAGAGLVVFTNGDNGLAVMPDLLKTFAPGDRPSLAWLEVTAQITEKC